MYIPVEIINAVFIILGLVVLGYIIVTLNNFNKLLKNVNSVVASNTDNINTSLNKLPNVIENCGEISESVKDITEVATDMTADIIVAKENVKSNVDLAVDIVNIVKQVFAK